jgi:MFS family permease
LLFSASYLLIIGLPLLTGFAVAKRLPVVILMISLLFAHQLFEYLGTVALWTWWGDLVPERVRGRYFARRQRIQLAVTIPTLLASGYFADAWRKAAADDPQRLLTAYAVPTGIGAVLLLASVVPLLQMPATRSYPRPKVALTLRAITMPFGDRRFLGLLVFRGWFSLANGISQVVQNVFLPKDLLKIGVAPMNAMRVTTQLGQIAGARTAGRLSDRFGNRPVLVLGQLLVSLALVFFLVARPDSWWLLFGAWVLFAAYVAHNICLPNLALKLSPDLERPGYLAAAEAIASMLHAVSTIAGGLAFDYLRAAAPVSSPQFHRSCLVLLGAGLMMRLLAVPLAAMIHEPGAWTWREIVKGQRRP